MYVSDIIFIVVFPIFSCHYIPAPLFFLILAFLGNTLSRSSRVLPSKFCKVVLIPLLCVIPFFYINGKEKTNSAHQNVK